MLKEDNDRILLLFPDGVGIRNYLYSDVFDIGNKEFVLLHAFDSRTESKIKNNHKISRFIRIPSYRESFKEKFLRELICLTRLKFNAVLVGNSSIISNWKSKHKGILNSIFYKIISFISFIIKDYNNILKLDRWYQKVIRNTEFYSQIKEILFEVKPDKIFCSHQRGVQCATIFAVAQDLGIETITVIYSWDNLPKARLALRADKYLVWSDYMKEEIKLYYPEIKDNQIFVTGTPQFECYHNPENIIPKHDFYNKYDLDVNKKIICYSGDDVLTCPDDPKYLNDLADELLKNGLENQFQILLRRCPVDVSGRFDSVVKKYPELIKQAPPLWNFQSDAGWTTIYPSPQDVQLLVSTAYYSDYVVNLGSTMAFDFGMFQKSCIYINYDQLEKTNPNWSVDTIYKFQHFRSMPSKKAVLWWNQKEDLRLLLNQKNDNIQMEKWINVVLGDYRQSSKKIKEVIL